MYGFHWRRSGIFFKEKNDLPKGETKMRPKKPKIWYHLNQNIFLIKTLLILGEDEGI